MESKVIIKTSAMLILLKLIGRVYKDTRIRRCYIAIQPFNVLDRNAFHPRTIGKKRANPIRYNIRIIYKNNIIPELAYVETSTVFYWIPKKIKIMYFYYS